MSERIPSLSEDPLPLNGEYSYIYSKEPKGTLDELVVTDPRDPFVWLQTEDLKPYEMPSTNGKHLLWFIYRMNGNMPQTESGIKWRDDIYDVDTLLKDISRTDMSVANSYVKHLAHVDAENVVNDENLKPQTQDLVFEHAPRIKLHEPNSELIFAAIMQHLDLISEYPKVKQ